MYLAIPYYTCGEHLNPARGCQEGVKRIQADILNFDKLEYDFRTYVEPL
jgi:hypothetical protein